LNPDLMRTCCSCEERSPARQMGWSWWKSRRRG